MMYIIWIIIILIALKLYTKIHTGWCYSRTIMTGKNVIITGANSGIGFETAFNLARRGAKVYLACRNMEKAKKAAEDIKKRINNANVIPIYLDLSSLKSVRDFVDEYKRREVTLDVLVNNAGAIGYGTEKTEDGIVKEIQVNYLGHFLLTLLLVPLLKVADSGRVIFVSSVLHKFGDVTLKSLNECYRIGTYYSLFKMYSNSKMYMLLFSKELSRRLIDTNVTVNSLHPGHVRTSIYDNVNNLSKSFMNFVLSNLFKSSLEGAQTSIYLAVSDEVYDVTGKYFVDCKESLTSGKVNDEELSKRLWSESCELVKLRPDECEL